MQRPKALLMPAGGVRTKQRRGTVAGREAFWGLLFISPILLGIVLWFLGPMIAAVYMSLTEWTLLRPPKFVGLQNFQRLMGDRLVWQALKVTSIYTAVVVPLTLAISFMSALLLNARRSKAMYGFRVAFYLPSLVPPVANAVLWNWILNSEFGLANWALRSVGLPKVLWLQDTRTALPALMLMSLWGFGWAMVIFLAGLQSIPIELYEAAKIDGAGMWRSFVHVTVPMISSILFFNLIMGVIGSFQVFTAGYLITRGGPRDTTLFYALHLYRNAFSYLRMGYAAAMAWVLFFIIVILTAMVFRYLGRSVYYIGS